ncbi:trehalase family glycosidase [Winogradskyella sp.]|jgi:putative isomerase|uniref:MGH1-like glycoside hydrolase domain-containing protein n=1 Tax=Winogradskyella sp. TaxID=1883156 RepID=UPI0025F70F06|nr:trehalase family glycosidase [Winogradskyella sp.]MCT4629850.1 trehalase family glycosidase [Winogradskyella sp.]
MKKLITLFALAFFFSCNSKPKTKIEYYHLKFSKNSLDYRITPKHKFDKDGLMFSDQGAWFAYSFSDSTGIDGFSGPFLMTQQNGVWSSTSLANLKLKDNKNSSFLNFSSTKTNNFNSHLEEIQKNDKIELKKELVFISGHTALQRFTITNNSIESLTIHPSFGANLFEVFSEVTHNDNQVTFNSNKSSAKGVIQFLNEDISTMSDSLFYNSHLETSFLKPNESKSFVISQSFIFPEYSWEDEQKLIASIDFDSVLSARKSEKNAQLKSLIENRKPQFQDSIYAQVLAKAQLTLQNNWRIPAGEISHEGLFPSYHYVWFNGFWSWDSWKHSVGLSYYDLPLAKEQIKLMFKFQNEDGFVADCVYRDTTIEAHNYRDTKPPLSAWAVAKIYEKDNDIAFVKYMYPKLKKYHYWWYNKRDHDKDGVCEYGSTDGSLVAAKWESGMDNAIRFDNSKILKNSEGAYSLDQESVDLNAYLYAEKLFLSELAKALQNEDSKTYLKEAETLKQNIQTQFYDEEDGWFYDTTLDGNTFIKGEGSEGWTTLWANAATKKQAEQVKNRMMNPEKFFTKVPFQTMSADHEKFDPLKGYWRGPNWLDQAYFGIKGLRNYGYIEDADKATIQLLKGANGILEKGKAIRENYHPLTGKGLHAHNFSWSAAHIIMMLQND